MTVVIAALLLALVVLPTIVDLAISPTVRRLGLRNAARRPGEAALVVAGSTLATALIVASLLVGDSFGASVRGQVSTSYGPLDLIVPIDSPSAAADRLSTVNDGAIDGLLPVVYGEFVAGGVGPNATVVRGLQLVELEPFQGQTFGGDASANGLEALPLTLRANEVVLNDRSAGALRVAMGDQIRLFLDQRPVVFDVVAVLDRHGLAGFADIIARPQSVTSQIDAGTGTTPALFISNTGDDTAGAELTDAVSALVADTLGDETSIFPVKQTLLDEADDQSAEMTELFSTIGGFGVVAGVLLLVNLFLMLAVERRREIGTMQALGIDRSLLGRAFAVEGFLYALLAALLGALLGIGVGAVVLQFAASLFDSDGDVSLALAVKPSTVAVGAAAGLAISQLTVLVTSWHVTRVHIVTAMKGLDAPPSQGFSKTVVRVGVGAAVTGGLALTLFRHVDLVLLCAPVAIVIGAVPALARVFGVRLATVGSAAVALALSAGVFTLWGDRLLDPELDFFLVQGVLLVGLGALLLAGAGQIRSRRTSTRGSERVALRLGLAHPLERTGRTGLLVAMYALVIFTVTFMAVLNSVFQQQVPTFAAQIGGDFDVLVDSSPTSPFTAEELESRDDVRLASPVLQGDLEYTYVDDDDTVVQDFWLSSTIPPSYPAAQGPRTLERLAQFIDDEAAWSAVSRNDDWIIVPAYSGFAPGDELTVLRRDEINRRRGERVLADATTVVTVAATTALNYAAEAGFYVSSDLGGWLVDGVDVVSRHYLVAEPGAGASALADALNSELERGASARTFLELAQADVDEQQAFIRLLQGYLAVGLLIGLAGLSVVLIRSVREREQQLGVLSAIGLDPSVLRNVFVVEAGFVGAQGVALGIGLGLVSSWLVITKSDAFASDLGFAVPTLFLMGLALVACLAAVAAGAIPARRAAKTSPAMALRVTT